MNKQILPIDRKKFNEATDKMKTTQHFVLELEPSQVYNLFEVLKF